MPREIDDETRVCRGPTCGRPLRMLLTAAGKVAPVDAMPQRLYVVIDGRAEIRSCYTPHHATCPDVEYFRKRVDT